MDSATRKVTGIALALAVVATVYSMSDDLTTALVALVLALPFVYWGFRRQLPRHVPRYRIQRWYRRRKRVAQELRYRLLVGSISREEEGVRKDYKAGDIVGLNATQASRNWNRLEGPLDDDD